MSLPALLGGVPVADAGTYPSWPQWGEREREELLATLDSGAWWTGDGERAFRYCQHDIGHAVTALRLAAGMCGWKLRVATTWPTADLARLLGLDRRPAIRSRTARRRSRRRSWPAGSVRATR